jgi:ABC-type glycerol-3-phosphate transport system substrate-binding protein
VEFKWFYEKSSALRKKIKNDILSGKLADIFSYWTRGSVRNLVEKNLLLEVHDYLAQSKKIKWEDFPIDAWKAYSFDSGKTAYGFPFEGSTSYLMVNKKIFNAVGLNYPKTHQELIDISKELVKAGYIPISVGSEAGNPAHFWFAAMYYQFEESNYMDGVREGINSFYCKETVHTAELIIEQLKAGVFPDNPIANGGFGNSVDLYNKRKAAMVYSCPWVISSFKDKVISESDLIEIPEVPDAKIKPVDFAVGGSNYGMVVNRRSFSDPNKQKHLVEFLDFFLSDEILIKVAASGQWVDKIININPDEVSLLYNKIADYQKGKKLLINLWAQMPDPTTQEVFSLACDELWAQTITAKEFAKKVQGSIEKFYQTKTL